MLRTALSLIALSLLSFDALAQSRAAASGAADLPALSKTLESLASRVDASVVKIFVKGLGPVNAGDVAGMLAPESATGSGVILDHAGYIVTNAHVVLGAVSDGRPYRDPD